MTRNTDIAWDGFDSGQYWEQNYATVRSDDAAILRMIAEYFSQQFAQDPPDREFRAGIDIGSGTNLCPALLMLPFVQVLHITDRSAANVAWLADERTQISSMFKTTRDRAQDRWEPYWRVLQEAGNPWRNMQFYHVARRMHHHGYGSVFTHRCNVNIMNLDVLDVPRRAFDIATMFFVAESMTTQLDEFHTCLERFIGSLLPGGMYAAAFMERSEGYTVGGVEYPAVPVTAEMVFSGISPLVDGALVTVRRVPVAAEGPLREGHMGMIVAYGRV